ncbi:hypothetical protein [Sphingobacterium detergens]|uniref:Uncharacterized protein n=1 Tax=Sphingobacterium detergens TaxID=1145106 RepID=A0A420B6P1_SPHD1|nr:hypothetical protein [Sphingobacterium detergens]RKE52456.1 hypothetical protein DFQ12_2693 [Sphingobacterium detergens]
MKYDTTEKRAKFLRKKGSIITFKKPFYPNGTLNESRRQIIVIQLQKDRSGAVKIIGNFYDSNWYDSLDDLINSIDWKWMESAHSE